MVFKKYADVAQLVEQLIRNEQVAGSNPFIGSNKYKAFRGCPGSLFVHLYLVGKNRK